jgi:hypothetical protein
LTFVATNYTISRAEMSLLPKLDDEHHGHKIKNAKLLKLVAYIAKDCSKYTQ